MTTTEHTSRTAAIERFEAAERALLERHGVAATTRRLTLGEPFGSVRVIEHGRGDPLLLVHGGGSTASEWAPLLDGLHDRRCIAVDRPGCGGSDAFDYTGVDVRRHAVAFLERTLDALGLERVPLVANSMGALWSLWLALDRPERVCSLALLGAPALLLGSSAPLPMRLLGVRGLNRLLMRLQAPSPRQMRGVLRLVAGARALERMDPAFVEASVCAESIPGADVAWRTLLERCVRPRGSRLDLGEDELRRVRQPTLFAWGADDAFAGPRLGRRACAVMPDATLEALPGGHLPWWDEPRRCGELVSAFLRAQGATAPPDAAARTA